MPPLAPPACNDGPHALSIYARHPHNNGLTRKETLPYAKVKYARMVPMAGKGSVENGERMQGIEAEEVGGAMMREFQDFQQEVTWRETELC